MQAVWFRVLGNRCSSPNAIYAGEGTEPKIAALQTGGEVCAANLIFLSKIISRWSQCCFTGLMSEDLKVKRLFLHQNRSVSLLMATGSPQISRNVCTLERENHSSLAFQRIAKTFLCNSYYRSSSSEVVEDELHQKAKACLWIQRLSTATYCGSFAKMVQHRPKWAFQGGQWNSIVGRCCSVRVFCGCDLMLLTSGYWCCQSRCKTQKNPTLRPTDILVFKTEKNSCWISTQCTPGHDEVFLRKLSHGWFCPKNCPMLSLQHLLSTSVALQRWCPPNSWSNATDQPAHPLTWRFGSNKLEMFNPSVVWRKYLFRKLVCTPPECDGKPTNFVSLHKAVKTNWTYNIPFFLKNSLWL